MTEETGAWGDRHGVVAGVTDRAVGSLGLVSPTEPVGEVLGRWRSFLAALAPRFPALAMARQVHETTVLWHENVAPGWHISEGADGHATRQRGLMLAVTVADCVPIYLAGEGVVALLHAGWRGVAAGMLEAGVKLVAERGGVRADRIAAHFGLAVCERCYEVGPEVIRAVLGRRARGPEHIDLRTALAGRAAALGVGDVSTSPACPSCRPDRYYSHRASRGADLGRQIAYLGIPPAR